MSKKQHKDQEPEVDRYEEAANEFAASAAKVVKAMAVTFGDFEGQFSKELKAVCGTQEMKSVRAFLTNVLENISPKSRKKAKLKAVK